MPMKMFPGVANFAGFGRAQPRDLRAGAEQGRARGLGRPSPGPAGSRGHLGGRAALGRRVVLAEVDVHDLHDALLRDFGLPATNRQARRFCALLLDRGLQIDGGVSRIFFE